MENLRFLYNQPKDIFRGSPSADPSTGTDDLYSVVSPARAKTVGEIIYSEPRGNDIMDVFLWFKKVGSRKNWVLGNNESLFAERLTALSRGESVDFLIWNCIGFKWFEDRKRGFPSCDVNSNLDAAITLYFIERMQESCEMLSLIGNPKVTILIPSNEAFDDNLWQYRQSYDERERIIDETVAGLKKGFANIPLPSNMQLRIERWDNFIKSRKAKNTTKEYSLRGKLLIEQANNFDKIRKEAVESGKDYFVQNGIDNIKSEILQEKQLYYYGVYAGEGIFYRELQEKGNNVVIVNFEERRVSQMASFGANNSLPVVTPITENQMTNYYQWRKERIQQR